LTDGDTGCLKCNKHVIEDDIGNSLVDCVPNKILGCKTHNNDNNNGLFCTECHDGFIPLIVDSSSNSVICKYGISGCTKL